MSKIKNPPLTEQCLVTNREFLKREWQRSKDIESKISYILIAHGVLFNLAWNIFEKRDTLSVALVFLFYGISFILSIYALQPITLSIQKWQVTKSLKENNIHLCKIINETQTEVNKQCDRFTRAWWVFRASSIYFIFVVTEILKIHNIHL